MHQSKIELSFRKCIFFKKWYDSNTDILEKPGNKRNKKKNNTCGLVKKIKRTISSNIIIWKILAPNNFITGAHFYGQNGEKHKKDRNVKLFPNLSVLSFHISRRTENFWNFLTKVLIGNRKGVFLSLSKTKKIKKTAVI